MRSISDKVEKVVPQGGVKIVAKYASHVTRKAIKEHRGTRTANRHR